MQQLEVVPFDSFIGNMSILEPGRSSERKKAQARGSAKNEMDSLPSFARTQKSHDEHVVSDFDRFWAWHSDFPQSPQVSELLLGPESNHFPRVAAAVATFEAVFARDISIAVFEH